VIVPDKGAENVVVVVTAHVAWAGVAELVSVVRATSRTPRVNARRLRRQRTTPSAPRLAASVSHHHGVAPVDGRHGVMATGYRGRAKLEGIKEPS
jgi:hypothetical protein